jgi:hypothetical protein
LFFAGLIAGFGALLGDLAISHFVRNRFIDEVQKLSQEKNRPVCQKIVPSSIEKYLLASLDGLLIASRLPTEIGITLHYWLQ